MITADMKLNEAGERWLASLPDPLSGGYISLSHTGKHRCGSCRLDAGGSFCIENSSHDENGPRNPYPYLGMRPLHVGRHRTESR